jgi:hypothetical protein
LIDLSAKGLVDPRRDERRLFAGNSARQLPTRLVTVAAKVQVRGRKSGVWREGLVKNPERYLGLDLTQFDAKRRIPPSSLGSWENFSGLTRGQSVTRNLLDNGGFSGPPISASGSKSGVPDASRGEMSGSRELGCGRQGGGPSRFLTAIQTENRAHVVGSGPTARTTLHRRHTEWQ